VKNVQISTKFLGIVYEETSISRVKKLDILCYWWRYDDVIFPCF